MNRTFTLFFLLYPIALPFGYVLVYTFYHCAVPDANSDLRFIKNFNHPNEELKLTGYGYCNYVSLGNTSGYGYATIYGMYDNNNGNAISGQMAITSSGEVLKRSYKNGAWTNWKNVDDYDTNLKRMPLDGTVEFNQFTITKNTSGKYVLNFYKNTVQIASIVSA